MNIESIFPNEGKKKQFEVLILSIGILLFAFGIYQIPSNWVFKSDLIKIQGTLFSADVNVKTVVERGRSYRPERTHQISELIFYLNEHKQKYSLAENLDKKYHSDEHARILKGLLHANLITVWIKKSDEQLYEPKVYQIDGDNSTLLEFERVRTENRILTVILLLFGVLLIGVFFWLRYPEKMKKILN